MGRVGRAEREQNRESYRNNCDTFSLDLKQVAPHRAPYRSSMTDLSAESAYIRIRVFGAILPSR